MCPEHSKKHKCKYFLLLLLGDGNIYEIVYIFNQIVFNILLPVIIIFVSSFVQLLLYKFFKNRSKLKSLDHQRQVGKLIITFYTIIIIQNNIITYQRLFLIRYSHWGSVMPDHYNNMCTVYTKCISNKYNYLYYSSQVAYMLLCADICLFEERFYNGDLLFV